MFSALLTQISTQLATFSRAFFIAAVLPLVLTVIAYFLLATWLEPGAPDLAKTVQQNLGTVEKGIPIALLFVFGTLVLSMIQPALLGFLEGKYLGPLRPIFVAHQQRLASDLNFRLMDAVKSQIYIARSVVRTDGASEWTDPLEGKRRESKLVTLKDLAGRSELPADTYDYVVDRLKLETDQIHNAFRFTSPQIPDRKEWKGYSSAVLAPTRIGNIGRTTRAYGLARYGFDLDIFWTRLQRTMGNSPNDKFVELIQTTKSQVDFSVAMVFLSAGLWLVWTARLLLGLGSLFQIVLLSGLGPLVPYLFYCLACQNYIVLSDQTRTSVDMYRLALLKDFNLPRPANLDEERNLWFLLGKHIGFADEVRFTFRKDGQ